MTRAGDPRERASRDWYGYGRWAAPYWFIGMEPGGADDAKSYEAWEALGADDLIDCRAHHMSSTNPLWTKWHLKDRPPTQPTWRRLIQLMLAYQGEPTCLDRVREIQRSDWGSLTGKVALLEVSAIHSPSLSKVDLESPLVKDRLRILRKRLAKDEPEFAVFYGLGYQRYYESVVGEAFDDDGFTWCGPTLCALTPGPTSARGDAWGRAEWWIAKGNEIRDRLAGATRRTQAGS